MAGPANRGMDNRISPAVSWECPMRREHSHTIEVIGRTDQCLAKTWKRIVLLTKCVNYEIIFVRNGEN